MRYRLKPTRPGALFATLVSIAILIVGVTSFRGFSPIEAVWVVVLVGVVAFNLWAAFAPRGGLYTLQQERGPRRSPRWR
jgi:ABC-type transport system involved in cytochrome c biogenesis permease subunit